MPKSIKIIEIKIEMIIYSFCFILGFDFYIFLKCMISCLRNALKTWKAQLLVINYSAYIIKIITIFIDDFLKWIIFWVHILLHSFDFLFIFIKLYSLGLNASWGPMILSVLVLRFAFILSHICAVHERILTAMGITILGLYLKRKRSIAKIIL